MVGDNYERPNDGDVVAELVSLGVCVCMCVCQSACISTPKSRIRVFVRGCLQREVEAE
jgi:hypothetical protein